MRFWVHFSFDVLLAQFCSTLCYRICLKQEVAIITSVFLVASAVTWQIFFKTFPSDSISIQTVPMQSWYVQLIQRTVQDWTVFICLTITHWGGKWKNLRQQRVSMNQSEQAICIQSVLSSEKLNEFILIFKIFSPYLLIIG